MPWLIEKADFVACHNQSFIGRYDMLSPIKEKGVFLLNTNIKPEKAFSSLTEEEQRIIIDRKVRFFVIDALKIADQVGLGRRINTVMQACFFKIAGVLQEEKAIT